MFLIPANEVLLPEKMNLNQSILSLGPVCQDVCKVVEHATIREDCQIQNAGTCTDSVSITNRGHGEKKGKLKFKIQRFKRDLLHTMLIALE